MTPMLPGLTGTKMSASDERTKIDILDEPKTIKKKVLGAFCPEAELENNGVMTFLKYVVMVYKQDNSEKFVIKRPEKWGGEIIYESYTALEKDYLSKQLHPQDLKKALAEELINLLEPVRNSFKGKDDIIKKAYPSD
jgi:tyrosyl-tRNA synthetase